MSAPLATSRLCLDALRGLEADAPQVYAPAMTVGPYLLLEELGRGGMGVVFRAHHLGAHRDVALKLLPPACVADPLRRSLLEREARAAAAIVHPNVTAVVDVAPHAAVPYLAMELVRGQTLRARLRGGETLGLDVALQIAHGLAAAHAAGVVHRDLKPENVVLGEAGAVKILDFGLATLHDSADAATCGWGTRQYMAPEQLRGEPGDARADVYAFGVVLHELLTGVLPDAVRHGGVKVTACDAPISLRRAEAKRALDRASSAAVVALEHSGAAALVRACLAEDPAQRPASALELVRALELRVGLAFEVQAA